MKTNYKFTILLSTVLILFAGKSFSQITDADGNNYKTVSIGGQKWTSENLNTAHYRNGDTIQQVQDPLKWAKLTTGAWCYYEDSSQIGITYGKLYNWYAVNDPRGLAPEGWHVATYNEWFRLTVFLGGENIAGQKLKGKTGWFNEGNGTDESGFNAVPGGIRDGDGSYYDINKFGCFWSSTESSETTAWYFFLIHNYPDVAKFEGAKERGLSVRLVKD